MIAQYIVNGILIGSLYACLAVGFSGDIADRSLQINVKDFRRAQ